jgi:REP element-mobilizing transposase RayT
MKTASYSHCHGESSFHIVFSPKYRHDVFGKDEIKTFCEKCFNEVAGRKYYIRHHILKMAIQRQSGDTIQMRCIGLFLI